MELKIVYILVIGWNSHPKHARSSLVVSINSLLFVLWLTFPSVSFPLCVSPSSKDQAEMDPADMEDVEEVEEEETGEDENSKG